LPLLPLTPYPKTPPDSPIVTRSLEKALAPLRAGVPASKVASSQASRAPHEAHDPLQALARLAGWMEPRHTLLLRTLLDRADAARSPAAPAVASGVHRVPEELRRDVRLKYAEFRERWETRLAPPALLPFLNRNQWIVPHADGGVVLAGKGTRQEARMLYLQTGHDMATDCARQWASIGGRLQAFEA